MCDQYDGNCAGDVHAYWDEYKAYYGIPSRNLSNWISISPSHIEDWVGLLNLASNWGINPIWIYGGDPDVDENILNYFCSTA